MGNVLWLSNSAPLGIYPRAFLVAQTIKNPQEFVLMHANISLQNVTMMMMMMMEKTGDGKSECRHSRNQFSSVQSLSRVQLFATPWTAACQASLSITNSQSLLRLMPIKSVMPSNHLIFCRPLLLPPSLFPSIRVFQMSQFFASGGQGIGVSASASVLSMNIQDWSPLGWTGWISLQSKGLSRVSSNTTVQKHQFFGAQLSYSPTLTSICDYWKNHSFD